MQIRNSIPYLQLLLIIFKPDFILLNAGIAQFGQKLVGYRVGFIEDENHFSKISGWRLEIRKNLLNFYNEQIIVKFVN